MGASLNNPTCQNLKCWINTWNQPTSPTPALLWISARRRKKKVAIITCAKQTRQINSLKSKKPDLGWHGKIAKQTLDFYTTGWHGMAWHCAFFALFLLWSQKKGCEKNNNVQKIYKGWWTGLTITVVVIVLKGLCWSLLPNTGWLYHVLLGCPFYGIQ